MDKLMIDRVAQAIYNVVQNNCYCNPLGVVDGIMSGEDWHKCAEAAIAAMQPNKESEPYPPDFIEALKYDQALKEYPTQNPSPLDGLNIVVHVITGDATKPNTRWCSVCQSRECVLDA